MKRRPDFSSFGAIRQLSKWRSEQDVVLTNTAVASALVRLTSRTAPTVYFAHGLHWNNPQSIRTLPWRLIESALLRRTDGIILLNDEDESWIRERFDGPIRRLAFGVGLNISTFTLQDQIESDTLRLVWIGEFSDRKRPFEALKIAERLKALGVSFQLTMWGRGSLHAAVSAAIDDQGLGGEVFLGGFGDSAITIADSHALIHTSTWEGLPRVILEACAIGRPVFGYDVKGVRGAPGTITVADGDSLEMAKAIRTSWSTGRLRQPMGERPSPSDLSDVQAAKDILTLLEEVVNNKGRRE
jgi:glycosyltransferase involved in cell wall biosynthesis